MSPEPRDKTCLSYWFPILEGAGVPVPKTEIIHAKCDLDPLLDGELPPGFTDLVLKVQQAGDRLSYPCFLRTGHFSGKHDWQKTCYLDDRHTDVITSHINELVLQSALVDFVGLPTEVWVVRELLNTHAAFTAFNNMPITCERRYFVRDGQVEYHHPYWPLDAIRRASAPDWQELLADLNQESEPEIQHLTEMSQLVGNLLPGYWSVDWLRTSDRGWVLIDMAEGEHSFCWDKP